MALALPPAATSAVTAVGRQVTGVEKAFPVTLLLDRGGHVLLSMPGVPTVSQVRKLLNEIES
jgi:hypothetical protein